ncbi:unnamed protein product [Didymodactylos carnosus]|uniref:Uncharacterized protein n=1 Tax=Didymodactylos carnosus TaxID=1234261 RepID=A0A8S2ER85_9BILA|nr:unnamed protein product [Didymodactylos carnosus]CAF4041478.1 unnamed protein product [Didymodactylos carnosus]
MDVGQCPVEDDSINPKPVSDSLNYTIFVKSFIEFPKFNTFNLTNIGYDSNYLKSCIFHRKKESHCTIFRVNDLLKTVENDGDDERGKMLASCDVIRVKIDWDCNLDKPLNECRPEYTFGRLDSPYKIERFSFGFNFRFASHWKCSNRSFRTLTKAFGLRFIIAVTGKAGLAIFIYAIVALNFGQTVLDFTGYRFSVLPKQLSELEKLQEQLQKYEDDRQMLEEQREQYERDRQEIEQQINGIKRQIQQLELEIKEVTMGMQQLENEIKRIQQE